MQQPIRPSISKISNSKELRRWYWRKDELLPFARKLGLKTTGGKFEILERIGHFIDTGHAPKEAPHTPRSKYNWHSAPLDDSTLITDNYKNTQNVRRYFISALGEGFKFNIAFMDWIKENSGRTLKDACHAYRAIKAQQNTPGFTTKIKSHNQFNQYTRDFLDAHPDLTMDDVRRIWARKIQRPSEDGRHVYHPDDLLLE